MSLARDVKAGFGRRPRSLPPKYFYDALGSRLFEAIGQLPWYRITQAETRLLKRAAPAVAGALQGPVRVVELGSGSGEKLALVVEALRARRKQADVHVVDLSAPAVAASLERLAKIPGVRVRGHRATYEKGLLEAASGRRGSGACLVLFLGSNIGNFDRGDATRLLAAVRRCLRPGDALLLGTDLVKPRRELLAAYDDPLGLTAVFNLNLLLRLNRELGADFDLSRWRHRAAWNAGARRVEMHLVSLTHQRVRIPGARVVADFAAGETLWTESSHKYEPEDVDRLAAAAGFRCERRWVDDGARFALTLCRAVPVGRRRGGLMKIPGACAHIAGLKTVVPAKKPECEECVKTGSSWVHLRTCQTCGGTRCCDSSPNRHASQARQELGPSRHLLGRAGGEVALLLSGRRRRRILTRHDYVARGRGRHRKTPSAILPFLSNRIPSLRSITAWSRSCPASFERGLTSPSALTTRCQGTRLPSGRALSA